MKSFLGMIALTAIVVTGCEKGSFYSAPGGETAVDRVQNQQLRVVYQEVETQKQKVRELNNYLNSGVRDPNPTIAIKIGDHVFRSEGEDLSPAEIVEGLAREQQRIRIALNVPEDVRTESEPDVGVAVTTPSVPNPETMAILQEMQEGRRQQGEMLQQMLNQQDQLMRQQGQSLEMQREMLNRMGPIIPTVPSPVRLPDCSRPPGR